MGQFSTGGVGQFYPGVNRAARFHARMAGPSRWKVCSACALQRGRALSRADGGPAKCSCVESMPSFNGAARFHARMELLASLVAEDPGHGFNGAARFHARMGHRMASGFLLPTKLQRGRALSRADGRELNCRWRSRLSASTGPRAFTRGWGTWRQNPSVSEGFNGAARFHARMAAESTAGSFISSCALQRGRALSRADGTSAIARGEMYGNSLQRGRALSRADGPKTLDTRGGRGAASTGPRAFTRGWATP